MTAPTPCALLIDRPEAGPWNMALDESLLESFAEGEQCCWRFYGWAEPTLSLGYFQSRDDRRRHPASLGCPIVRRASGGGAILHDVELTYSFVAPARSSLAQHPSDMYEAVHGTLIETLDELGVCGASLAGHIGGKASGELPFLCFERRSPGDVVYGEAKIAGSAQRRRQGAVLQHGSVLIGRSNAAPELPGIKDLAQCELSSETLLAAWLPRLTSGVGLTFSEHTLTNHERQRAAWYVANKYGTDEWTTNRKSRPD